MITSPRQWSSVWLWRWRQRRPTNRNTTCERPCVNCSRHYADRYRVGETWRNPRKAYRRVHLVRCCWDRRGSAGADVTSGAGTARRNTRWWTFIGDIFASSKKYVVTNRPTFAKQKSAKRLSNNHLTDFLRGTTSRFRLCMCGHKRVIFRNLCRFFHLFGSHNP